MEQKSKMAYQRSLNNICLSRDLHEIELRRKKKQFYKLTEFSCSSNL